MVVFTTSVCLQLVTNFTRGMTTEDIYLHTTHIISAKTKFLYLILLMIRLLLMMERGMEGVDLIQIYLCQNITGQLNLTTKMVFAV